MAANFSSPPRRWASGLAPLIAAVLGIGVVFFQWTSARPLWLDEEMIALNFRDRTLWQLTGKLWLDQTAPLGWLYLQRIILANFGDSEVAVRFIPALFGAATVACAAWIGYRWMKPIGATTFVLLCSFGQWLSFYSVELKQYSADTFFGLFLPAVTLAMLEAAGETQRKLLLFWGVALIFSHWLSISGVLVVPACTVLIAMFGWRRRQATRHIAAIYVLFSLSFGVHYFLSLRYARESDYLQSFWWFAFPPASSSVFQRIAWLARQLEPFALKPGGTGKWILFWITPVVGFLLARQRWLGAVAGLVVLSGFVFAALRLVPLYERLSLWFLPALFLGMSLFVDRAATLTRKLQPAPLVVVVIAAVISVQLCGDILRRGIVDLINGRPNDSNRAVDDRSSIAWLMSQRHEGDPLIATKLALPAVWWYARIPIGPDTTHFKDGAPVLVAEHLTGSSECAHARMMRYSDVSSRALIYFGLKDYPDGFDELVLSQLTEHGAAIALRRFGDISRAAIVDFDFPPRAEYQGWGDKRTPLAGCSQFRPAFRW